METGDLLGKREAGDDGDMGQRRDFFLAMNRSVNVGRDLQRLIYMFLFCMDYWGERKKKINAYQFMRRGGGEPLIPRDWGQ